MYNKTRSRERAGANQQKLEEGRRAMSASAILPAPIKLIFIFIKLLDKFPDPRGAGDHLGRFAAGQVFFRQKKLFFGKTEQARFFGRGDFAGKLAPAGHILVRRLKQPPERQAGKARGRGRRRGPAGLSPPVKNSRPRPLPHSPRQEP